uniref:LigA n=1 Tax=Parastrongyloides trichosuri TaxID=131310 RepID=A0A0N5A085_PARTI
MAREATVRGPAWPDRWDAPDRRIPGASSDSWRRRCTSAGSAGPCPSDRPGRVWPCGWRCRALPAGPARGSRRGLVRAVPVRGCLGLDVQGHAEIDDRQGGAFHDAADDGDGAVGLGLGGLEHQFVVDLQQHPGLKPRIKQGAGHADHGAADDVGGRALDRGVDGGALAELALGAGLGVDGRDVDAPPEDGGDEALLLHQRLGPVHIGADAGEALEIGLDVGSGLTLIDAQLGGQAEGADAVDDAEVDGLGPATRLAGHALDRHAEHFGRGGRVDVEAALEGALQLGNVADVGQQAQLDLAVVG